MNTTCYHCGDDCREIIFHDNKHFCCEGCKQVYLLLNENNLCGYYNLDTAPGIKAKGKFTSGRFAYLDDDTVFSKLVQFSSGKQVNVTFSIPQMHCSSCVFLLENLHRIQPGVIKSSVAFRQKEVFIIFDPTLISLRKVVELLAFVGYEPYISLGDSGKKKNTFNRKRIYQIGIAGFCFANIMMLSFPEYFSSGNIEQPGLKQVFSWLTFALSIPVLLFCAPVFFVSAWKGLRQRFLNIDAPIALATIVTFSRSYYEIISGHGAGYLDSGTGIVFFMLIGRWFQDKTYDSLSFDRDYRAYFPLGVTKTDNGKETNVPVTQLKKGDHILVRNGEMIAADAILVEGNAAIDYSFVTGESNPVAKRKGELIYAGGKQTGGAIELETLDEASQAYITRLWNNNSFAEAKNSKQSFIHPWSRYFTLALFTVAAITLVYWWLADVSRLLPSVTAVLIVACPCSLLLSATFTFGNMVRIFGRNKLYLKNASVIESMARVDTIVFDKTGTLTVPNAAQVQYEGAGMKTQEFAAVKEVVKQSAHPLSKTINAWLEQQALLPVAVSEFKEYSGLGAEAMVDEVPVRIGSSPFIHKEKAVLHDTGTGVYVSINNEDKGCFRVTNAYREGIAELAVQLRKRQYEIHVLSGDNSSEQKALQNIFGPLAHIHFQQSPQDKLEYIKKLQAQHKKVLMIGDGLNDAGALMQSDAGIAVSDHSARFTPACDAIIDGDQVTRLDRFLAYARAGKKFVTASFVLSILYNFVGISFAVQGILSPLVAAILMPASSISIVVLAILNSGIGAKRRRL